MGVELPVRSWRLRQASYRLIGEVCLDCNEKIFPPRDVCPHCGQKDHQKSFEFSGKGTVVSFTTMYEVPTDYEEFKPYVEAWIKLDEGPTVTARLTDLTKHKEIQIIDGEEREVEEFDVKIGDPVEMVTRIQRKDGDYGTITYGYTFRPPVSSPTASSP